MEKDVIGPWNAAAMEMDNIELDEPIVKHHNKIAEHV